MSDVVEKARDAALASMKDGTVIDITSIVAAAVKSLRPGDTFTIDGVEVMVVPVDPTENMTKAGGREISGWDRDGNSSDEGAAWTYTAMLSALRKG